MRTLLYIFLLLFPSTIFANSENTDFGKIKGVVTTSDGYAAGSVSVSIKNTGKGTITDANGNFEIRTIKPGKYELHFSLTGYIDSSINVEVMENETVVLKVQLRRSYAELSKVLVKVKTQGYVVTNTSESLRMNLPLIEVPQNIVVIPHQLLYDQGGISMTQAIRNISGVSKFYGELNDYSLNIRGTNSTFNIFRNGIGGLWWNQQEDVAMLDRIEFLKGPSGFVISLAEPGGIVNNVTKQPSKSPIANVEGGLGSFGLARIAVDLGGKLNKSAKLYYRFNAGIHHQERSFEFGKAIRYFICPALKYDFNKKTSLTAEFNYMYGKTSGNNEDLPSVNGEMFQLPRKFAVADPATDAVIAADNYYRLHLKHQFNDNWLLNVQAASVHGPWGDYLLRTDGENPISNDTLYRVSFYNHWTNYANPAYAFIEGKFNSGRKLEHKVLFGIDYHADGSKGSWGGTWGQKKFGLYIPNPNYYINPDSLKHFEINNAGHYKTNSIALYVQDHMKVAEKLVVTLAGHLTHVTTSWEYNGVVEDQSKTKDNVFTPRAGLTWLFGDNASLFALYDQCFIPQAGRSFELEPLKPLTGYNIETGLKSYVFNRKLTLNLSIFKIVKNNSLTADPLHNGYQIQTGQIVSKGIDFDVTGNILPSLLVNANYEYVDAKVTKDSDPNIVGTKNFGTPNHQANFWCQYKLLQGAFKGFSFSIGGQYMGKRSAVFYWWVPDQTKYLPGYVLFDAGIGFSRERFNIGLYFYNITNINYASMGYFNFNTNEWRYTPGEPINFRLTFGINLLRIKKA